MYRPKHLPLTDSQLISLGELAYYSAQIENVVDVILNELIDEDPQVGAALTGKLPFGQKASRILELIDLRLEDKKLASRVRRNIGGAKEVMMSRNSLLHSRWSTTENGLTVQIRGRDQRSRIHLEVTEDDLNDTSHQMRLIVQLLEVDWMSIVVKLGRTEPIEGNPNYLTVPNRWAVPGAIVHSGSRNKSDLDRWREGAISTEEYELRTGRTLG